MNRPTLEDFETSTRETSIEVRFKPTGSTFFFGMLTDTDNIVKFGLLSPGTVRYGGPTGDLDAYSAAADEVFAMAHQSAIRSVVLRGSRRK
jgi:hypothetical protein